MDWSNEEYVRLYTRETTDDLELSWEALAVWHAMLRKFDRSGLMKAKNGWRSVAMATRIPLDVVQRAGADLVKDGRVREVAGGFLAPNFIEAQTASKSDKSRQRESRDRRRREAYSQVIDSTNASHVTSQAVTPSHAESRDVTLCSALLCDPDTDPAASLPVVGPTLSAAEPERPSEPSSDGDSAQLEAFKDKVDAEVGDVGKQRARGTQIADDWSPHDDEREWCRQNGVNCDAEAEQFRDHHVARGTRFKDWRAGFRTWLRNAKKWRPNSRSSSSNDGLQVALRIARGEA
jgi:hypothetical protein